MRGRVLGLQVTIWLLWIAAGLSAEPKWTKIESCTLVQDGYRDGDSFLVRPKTFRVFRLYFVDTCEDSADQRYPERVNEQAKYFGVSQTRAFELGDLAAAFAEKTLSKPFTVLTCWQKAPGASSRQRFYAMIDVQDRWLSSILVEQGLARIYGKRITLPSGATSREYLALLDAMEAKAKRDEVGGWVGVPVKSQ
jgi:hypothetical protein